MSFRSTVTLNNGVTLPQIGLGTWLSGPNEVEKAVEVALKHGYRHLDLAKIYQNQDEVARGIKASGVPRKEIFITSKLWNTWHRPEYVKLGLEDTLRELDIEYLDLYLIHWPVPFQPPASGELKDFELFPKTPEGKALLDPQPSLVDTWKALIELQKSGKVRAIGVSNFTSEMIEGISNATGVVPAVNQVERHPLLPQNELIQYCKKKGVHVTAYSPLGNNLTGQLKIVDYPEVVQIAKAKSADPAQVLIAWGKAGGISVIPKSVTPSRIKSNFAEIELTEEEIKTISALGEKKTVRFNYPYSYSPSWDINVFDIEAEKPAATRVKIQ